MVWALESDTLKLKTQLHHLLIMWFQASYWASVCQLMGILSNHGAILRIKKKKKKWKLLAQSLEQSGCLNVVEAASQFRITSLCVIENCSDATQWKDSTHWIDGGNFSKQIKLEFYNNEIEWLIRKKLG